MKFNYDNGKLIESFSEVKHGEDMIKDAELFTVGKHRGREYTRDDLQRLADAFNPEEQVPLQLDHSESARDTMGFLDNVRVIGNKLMGQIRIIDEDTKKKVTQKLMKKLSISFYADSAGNPQKIREVSFVAFPQVKTAQLFQEENPLTELQKKVTALQFESTKLLAQQLERDINKLTREFSKKDKPKRLTDEERTKQAQEEFERFYENYQKTMNW
ncbi:hypothetical protein [Bacillus sp. XF8]|uniref:hypothetical protein n=1 Tax=Bacillus sp. XF8 TaxID=2819289 RepID=UPI001AA0166A|nr:hypothetical protein [Bacillus sp. XF8]MBO1579364.1 hypothetical protein [Bacillus sp. XF8]